MPFSSYLTDGQGRGCLDTTTGAVNTIDYTHHEIHGGNAYTITGLNSDIDVGQFLDLTVITPNTTKWVHVVFTTSGQLTYHAFVYEASVTNVAGSVKTAYNRNRNSSNVSGGTFREGDTFTTTGTLLWQMHFGAAGKSGGIFGLRDEFILKQNTQYLFRLESEIINNRVSASLDWYEHANR